MKRKQNPPPTAPDAKANRGFKLGPPRTVFVDRQGFNDKIVAYRMEHGSLSELERAPVEIPDFLLKGRPAGAPEGNSLRPKERGSVLPQPARNDVARMSPELRELVVKGKL